MGKLIIFKIGKGNFEQGFPVTLQIGKDGQSPTMEVEGRLPPDSKIPELYDTWKDLYYSLGSLGGMRIVVSGSQVTNVSIISQCEHAAHALEARLRQWLNQADVRDLQDYVRDEVSREEPARVILQTQDVLLRKLPLHLWSLFESRPKAELALSSDYAPPSRPLRSPVKILAILGTKDVMGSSDGIGTQQEWELLKQLPEAKVTLLEQPSRKQLNDKLWDHHWDILFFAGHSSSQNEGTCGQIQINETESIPLDQLKNALRTAVNNGLQLAIFNSCDGLGLARNLADLKISQVIVMREPVPVAVAQAFLRYFLQTFARGESFYLSVRKAREQLQGMQGDFPCATWLPVICQNPSATPLVYPSPKRSLTEIMAGVAITALSLGIVCRIIGTPVPQLPPPNPWANRISLGDKILLMAIVNPDKEAGVDAFRAGNFPTAVNKFQASLKQQRNDPETLIYLNNAEIANRRVLKIAVSVPVGSNLNVAEEILRGVAQAQAEVNHDGGVKGQMLEVEIANDENDPNIARGLATTFIKDSLTLAVIGYNASDASVAAAPLFDQGGLVMVSSTSFSDKLSSSGNYIFRMVPSIRFLADTLARYAIKINHTDRIAICSDSAAVDNESFRNNFTDAVIINRGQFVSTSCDFSAPSFNSKVAINEAISSGADSLLLAPHVDRINKAVEMARANQGRLTLLGSPTLYTAQTLQSGQNAVNGLVLSVPWHPANLPGNPFTRDAAKLWGGAVNWRTAMSYDATRAITTGLQQNQTRSGLKDSLRSPKFLANGASGTIQFLGSGERKLTPEIGGLVKVEPAKTPFGYDFVVLHPQP